MTTPTFNNKIPELEIYPEKNERGNYEIGRYYWKSEDEGEIWQCEWETYSHSNAVLASFFSKLYRLTDFILYPNIYIGDGQLSLALVEKAARKVRDEIDTQAGDLAKELANKR